MPFFFSHLIRFSKLLFAEILIGSLTFLPFSAQAFDSPFDHGGHGGVSINIPEGAVEPDPAKTPGPDPTGCNKSGSPFEVATGNFSYSSLDVAIPSIGQDLAVWRTFNSLDPRNGPFGHGWTFAYDQRVIETTNGVEFFAICLQGTGKRDRFVRNPNGSYTPPAHLFSTLTKHGDGTYSLIETNGFQRRFNTEGRLTAIIDRNGNSLQLTYDSTGFLIDITDATARTLKLTKGANGRIDSITDFTNRTFRYFYDGEGNLIEFVDPLGNPTRHEYDAQHRLIKVLDPRGNPAQEMTYDAAGRILTLKDQEGSWTVQYFPDQNKTTKRRTSDNSLWTFVYNANGNIVENTDPLGNKTLYAYNQHFNLTGFTDPNGNTTTLAYDQFRNLASTTDALGHVGKFTYEPLFQQISTITDRLGKATRLDYDAKGNLIKITDALGQV